jgi:hypothetical protein
MDMERPCRGFFVGLSLLCLASAGCLQFPYAFPEINYAPALAAQCKSSEVHAFRVDVTQTTKIQDGSGRVVEHEELSRVPTSAEGIVPSQMGLTFSSGWRYVGVVNFTSSSTEHGIALRLYRPGYDTIVMKPGERVEELRWKQASDLDAQAKAINDLMHGAKVQKTKSITVRHVLESGTKSPAHKAALMFGASEYERLARDLSASPAHEAARHELLEEADRLRNLADGKSSK